MVDAFRGQVFRVALFKKLVHFFHLYDVVGIVLAWKDVVRLYDWLVWWFVPVCALFLNDWAPEGHLHNLTHLGCCFYVVGLFVL